MTLITLGIIYGIKYGGNTSKEDTINTIHSVSNSTIFSIFLVIYIIILRLLTTRLKKEYPKFYFKERKIIIVANSMIIISIIFRIILNICYAIDSFNDSINKSIEKKTWFFPIVQLISVLIINLMPIAAILYQLNNALK